MTQPKDGEDGESGDITEKRDLRQSLPYWRTRPGHHVIAAARPARRAYDAVIVGAGISGALMAHRLARPGRSILVVDRRHPVRGSSMASTAMIQHEIDVPLSKLAKTLGPTAAGRVWRRSARAVLELEEIVRRLGIACDFERKDTLFLAGDEYGAKALKEEVEARHAQGLDADYLDRAALAGEYGLKRPAAIRSFVSASADPARMTAGILKAARARGVEIVSRTEAVDVASEGGAVRLTLRNGMEIEAGNVVFCTGYERLKAAAGPEQQVISSWALATRPGLALPGWLGSFLVWEGADPYLYLRSTPDGRLIAGGEDEESETACRDPARLGPKAAAIRAKLEKLLGIDTGEPDYVWAAAFGTTPDGLPVIGEVAHLPGVYAVMGFGGNGITFSQIAASIVGAAIDGRRDPDAGLFSDAVPGKVGTGSASGTA